MSSSSRSSPLEIFSFNPSSFFLVNHLFFLLFSSPSLLQLSSSSSLRHPATGDNSLLQAHIPSPLRPPATSNNSHYPPCFHEHFRALLDLKRSFHFTRLSRSNLSSWNENNRDNCCSWEGVTCNAYNAHVIALNLIGLRLYRLPDFNSLFRLRSLQKLNLSRNFFHAPIPSGFHQLSSLTHLDLSINKFVGQVPLDFSGLTKLVALDLSWNSGLSFKKLGMKGLLQNLSSLTELNLDGVDLSTEGSQVLSYAPPALRKLSMSDSGLSGPILPPPSPLPLISHVDFSFNLLSSPFPRFIANFTSLTDLDLHGCDLHGEFPKRIFNLPRIQTIDISFNQLLVGSFPEFSPNSSIQMLAMRNTGFYGMLPRSLGNLKSLTFLHLWNCNLSGPIPESVGELNQLGSLDLSENRFFSIANNQLSGDVSSQICNAKSLELMDLSNNNFIGQVPKCLGEMSHALSILKLGGNNLNGTFLQEFNDSCSLKTINLNKNRVEGKLPDSLANCKMLEVLDLGNNQINDTFPVWLKDLPRLRVLVLRSNQFHGTLGYHPKAGDFSRLQIFDIAFNNFTGCLATDIFNEWKAMVVTNKSEPLYLGNKTASGIYYEDTVTVMDKGNEMRLKRILRAFTLLDLSNNKFEGSIPVSVGNLKSLHVINMSHNAFTGVIPSSMGDIQELESLDLSYNGLSRKIPWQLEKIRWLAVLNLSRNCLEGPIPQGNQFKTFTNESFQGNLGLCGPPLSNMCGDIPPSPAKAKNENEYDWEVMWIAFGIGHGLGFGILFWTLALWRHGRIVFFTFTDRMLSFLFPPAFFLSCRCSRPRNPTRNGKARLKD